MSTSDLDKYSYENGDICDGRASAPCTTLTAVSEAEIPLIPPPPVPPDPTPPKPIEPFNPNEEPTNLTKPMFEPAFLPPKSISHSKISPSSIPNPSPSVSTTKQLEPGYPNYGSYLYSIPGYSAFQPLSSYTGMLPPHHAVPTSEPSNTDFVALPSMPKEKTEDQTPEAKTTENQAPKDVPKTQTDFEEQFTPEIIPATSMPDNMKNLNESKMSITSLAQGSGATVTIPSQICKDVNKKKTQERYSLKTSIPISKIDMKCVGNPPEPIVTNTAPKKPSTFNPAFSPKPDIGPKVEIQSNIVIKGAIKENEVTDSKHLPSQTSIKNINSLISAAETVNKSDSQFRKPEPKSDIINEVKEPAANFSLQNTNIIRPVISPMNIETSKASLPPKPQDGNFNEQKNQILFIQNKNQNPKMLLTIQQQNPQVLLQRTNFESKNAQVPSRLSSQSKNCKEEITDNGASSKVVALKRLHQENCDENDFENLITENQIYGNKIVVKEKSQRTLQEQEIKNKKIEKQPTQETKNVVLQPNFLYLSNVQFPANLMMIKNNSKVSQPTDANKLNKVPTNENKVTNEAGTMTNSNDINTKSNKLPNIAVSKEIHVLKSNNNVLQSLSNKNSKTDIVFQPHQKVIRNPQIVYQVPMIVDSDTKLNQPFINREYQKFIGQNKKEYTKLDSNDKLFIACPYQMDSKLQPKIVITNIRPKVNKVDEVSSLDVYEKRKRLRRLKYLSNRDTKEVQKSENIKKVPEKYDIQKNLITPDKINEEICKEFTNTKVRIEEGGSESESDYDQDALEEYEALIKEYSPKIVENNKDKAEFLSHFGLGTYEACKEKDLNKQERIIQRDLVASAYISAGRIDRLLKEEFTLEDPEKPRSEEVRKEEGEKKEDIENNVTLQKKQAFLSQLKLSQVNLQFKEGYEKVWLEIVKERKRRNGDTADPSLEQSKNNKKNLELDPNNQLQILTEIKKSVNENNNLIKKRLDSSEVENNAVDGDSIRTLAEKNFSELNRLSKMADRSVKLITGQDAKKRDLNPGFDSENIQKSILKQPNPNYSQINIPDIAKIISLKSQDTSQSQVLTSQATSMDEPVNSAAGIDPEELQGTKEFGCQVEETLPWPGVEAVMKSYRDYEAARRKEINDLHKRNTALRVEGAHITRTASRESDRARALLAERRLLANEEAAVKRTLQAIKSFVEIIKNYQ